MSKKVKQLRNVGIMLRVTASERAAFLRCAKKMSISLSGWMRMTLLAGVRSQNQHMRRQQEVLEDVLDDGHGRSEFSQRPY